MVNKWIMFLRQYSKDNNISYSCAITEAAPSYIKMKVIHYMNYLK